jgi:hypothetical protein
MLLALTLLLTEKPFGLIENYTIRRLDNQGSLAFAMGVFWINIAVRGI